jgi:hypothetical protein
MCRDLSWSTAYCAGFTGVVERSLELPVLHVSGFSWNPVFLDLLLRVIIVVDVPLVI